MCSRTEKKFIDRLFALARSLEKVGRARVISAVVYKGKILSLASNSYKTHPKQKKLSKSEDKIYLHAEVDAIIKALKIKPDLSKAIIYVVRAKYVGQTKRMEPGCAKPCKEICGPLIKELGLKVIHT